jgi:hypothetical protein
MPVVFIEAPPGIRAHAKKKMVEKVTSAIDEAYHIGGTLVFLRRKTWRWMGNCNRKTRKSWKPCKEWPTQASPAAKRL